MEHPSLPPSAAFAAVLGAVRRARGLTQSELSTRLGLAAAESVSRYERGDREPRLSNILRLANGLDVSPAALVGATSAVLSGASAADAAAAVQAAGGGPAPDAPAAEDELARAQDMLARFAASSPGGFRALVSALESQLKAG
jgi:transcriptional regulator with XRE-family HTH domain